CMDFESLARLPDDKIGLAEAALSFALKHYPQLEQERYLTALDELGRAASAELAGERGGAAKLERFISFLHEDQGFQGNAEHYYDPRNSYLNEVLDRRLGIPITLAVIWIEVAR